MKAENLTICVPNNGCDKDCPFCVSKMTGYVAFNENLFRQNINRVKTVARASGVTSVLLTGKGEPMLNARWVGVLAKEFEEWPVELQTNGLNIIKCLKDGDVGMSRFLSGGDLNTIAISADSMGYALKALTTLNPYRKSLNLRITFNIINEKTLGIPINESIFNIAMDKLYEAGASQVTFRKLSVPRQVRPCSPEGAKAAAYIAVDVSKMYESQLVEMIEESLSNEGELIRILRNGFKVYEYRGLAILYSDYCIQDMDHEDDIRSLIYMEDGHLYTNWNSPASMLF
jgi:hypothetical protein